MSMLSSRKRARDEEDDDLEEYAHVTKVATFTDNTLQDAYWHCSNADYPSEPRLHQNIAGACRQPKDDHHHFSLRQ